MSPVKDFGTREPLQWLDCMEQLFIKGFLRRSHKNFKCGDTEYNWPGERKFHEVNRDQILYSDFLTRLSGKAQLFIGQRDVMVRSRLTHTMEVMQIARQIAGEIDGLNPVLCEAIALAHDIGHPPFAHMGERVLNACLKELYLRRIIDVDKPSAKIKNDETIKSKQYLCEILANWKLYTIQPKLAKENLKRAYTNHEKELDYLFKTIKILEVKDGQYTIAPFEKWKDNIAKQDRTKLVEHFHMQDGDNEIFDHYRQGIRFLSFLSPKQDYSYQLVYGVATHSTKFMKRSISSLITDENYKLTLGPIYWLEKDNTGTDKIMPTDKQKIIAIEGKYHYTPELDVVRIADDIGWMISDFDDAVRAGKIDKELCKPWIEALGGEERWKRLLVQCSDVINSSRKNLKNYPQIPEHEIIDSTVGSARIKFKDEVITKLIYPRTFLRDESSRKIIRDLFWYFYDAYLDMKQEDKWPILLKEFPQFFTSIKKDDGFAQKYREVVLSPCPERFICDFIATLSDQETIMAYKAVFSPDFQPYPGPFTPTDEYPEFMKR